MSPDRQAVLKVDRRVFALVHGVPLGAPAWITVAEGITITNESLSAGRRVVTREGSSARAAR